MDKLKNALPYVLLLSFIALSLYKQPQIADSIIIIALCALSGFKFYLESKKQPNYLTEFNEYLVKQQKELEDLKTIVGMQNIAQKKREQSDSITW